MQARRSTLRQPARARAARACQARPATTAGELRARRPGLRPEPRVRPYLATWQVMRAEVLSYAARAEHAPARKPTEALLRSRPAQVRAWGRVPEWVPEQAPVPVPAREPAFRQPEAVWAAGRCGSRACPAVCLGSNRGRPGRLRSSRKAPAPFPEPPAAPDPCPLNSCSRSTGGNPSMPVLPQSTFARPPCLR